MKIVGTFLGDHDNGFSLIEDNKIIACYSEERFSRLKSCYNMFSFPKFSLKALKEDFDIDIKDPNIEFAAAKPVDIYHPEIIDILKHRPIKLYPHHYCHACGAYYTSGFDENTLVVSYDGGDCGPDNFKELNMNNLSKYNPRKISTHNSFYIVKDGKLVEIAENVKLKHSSVANLWSLFCVFFGMYPVKDEGKIMGLAAQGEYDEKIYNMLDFFIKNDLCATSWMIFEYYKSLFGYIAFEPGVVRKQQLPKTQKHQKLVTSEEHLNLKRKLAFNLQLITERTLVKFIGDVDKEYGPFKNLCVAGGIFANVKLNQKLNEELSFDNVWVYPAMGDEGLSLGAAIAHGVELGVFTNRKIDNVFLGASYTEDEIDSYLESFEYNYDNELIMNDLDYNVIGDLLVQGKIIGIFDGAAEYGPRALGGRSIMVEPTKKETHEYINMRLKRDEIMPFAPIIMEEYIDDICYYDKSKYTSEYMTMCYNVKEEWIPRIPAVINIYDGTARPQVVNKERHKHFHKILSSYYGKTGIPVLMNTSFNGHGEPIINSPQEALKHLADKTIDYLIINNKICNI